MAKILVVDDEPEIAIFVSKILEARNHEVFKAADGKEALDVARKELPDVMVLDVNLPKLDGFDVCRQLKGDPSTEQIRIILMTAAYTSVEDASQGEDCGADEYVVKPFLKEVLLHNVERLLPDVDKSKGDESS